MSCVCCCRFLYFLYSGNAVISDDYVVPLFLLAGKYNVRSLYNECAKLIERALKVYIFPHRQPRDPVLSAALSSSSSSSSSSLSAECGSDVSDLSDADDPQWLPAAAKRARRSDDDDDDDHHDNHPAAEAAGADASTTTGMSKSHALAMARSQMSALNDGISTYKPHVSGGVSKSQATDGVSICKSPRVASGSSMVASETFPVAQVLRLLERCHGHERVRRAALLNLEARVGNQIVLGNFTSTWLDLTEHIITAMLADSRFGYSEMRLFEAALAWLDAQPADRRSSHSTAAVLRCIRYGLLSTAELYDVERLLSAQQCGEADELVHEAMRQRLFHAYCTPDDRARWTGPQFTPRAIPRL